MTYFTDLTNTRREDIIKACKYHYGADSLHKIVAAHNGIENISDSDVLSCILHDVGPEIFWDGSAAISFVQSCIHTHGMNLFCARLGNLRSNDAISLLLSEIISRVTLLTVDRITGGKLPENCPIIEKMLVELSSTVVH